MRIKHMTNFKNSKNKTNKHNKYQLLQSKSYNKKEISKKTKIRITNPQSVMIGFHLQKEILNAEIGHCHLMHQKVLPMKIVRAL